MEPAHANHLLCEAAGAGDVERLRKYLEQGVPASGYWDPVVARASARAMEQRQREMMAELPDPFGDLPEEVRQQLTDARGELQEHELEQQCSAPWSFEIPLFCAVEAGHMACVELLLDAGADPQARDNSQQTALYHADSPEMVKKLVAAGVPLEDVDRFGWSPLVAAVTEGPSALPKIRALLAAGANVNAVHDRGYTTFMSAVGSFERDLEILRVLLEAGADPHAVSELGYNAFHAAIDVNGEANDESSVRATLEFLQALGVDMELCNHCGHTPLARAIHEGTAIEVQVLCELGADPNADCLLPRCGPDDCEEAQLPLLFHATCGSVIQRDKKIAALLAAGANPLAEDDDGCTPLSHAAAALCGEGDDYEGLMDQLFEGFEALCDDPSAKFSAGDERVATLEQLLRPYLARFAARIPLDSDEDYLQQWRKELLASIALLAAVELAARE